MYIYIWNANLNCTALSEHCLFTSISFIPPPSLFKIGKLFQKNCLCPVFNG